MVDLIMVMNAQNSFFSKTGSVYMGEKAEILISRIGDYLSGYNNKIIFFREKHSTEDSFFINDKTHSIATTKDMFIHDSLKKYATNFYDKTRYSAFYNTDLDSFLKREKVKNIGLMGIETHTSILFSAEELRNRNYEVTVIEPCTMSRDNHMHNYALTLMNNFLGVRISNG
jgi:nicotinamidase-related amidase